MNSIYHQFEDNYDHNHELPSYSPLYHDEHLPSYPKLYKRFNIRCPFTLFRGIPNSSWNIQESSTKLNWFKINPYERGLRLNDWDNSVLMKTNILPSQCGKLKFQIMRPEHEHEHEQALAEVIQKNDSLYLLTIYNSTSKGTQGSQYCIKKKRNRYNTISTWHIYSEGAPYITLTSFRLLNHGNYISEIVFSDIQAFEMYFFLVASCQILSNIYS